MAEKILSLDVGHYSVKAALFEATFRDYTLVDLYESNPLGLENIDPTEHDTVIREAISRIIRDNNIQASTYISALSGMLCSVYSLHLPLPSAQIAKVLPFELENYISREIEDLTIDHYVQKAEKTSTKLLAAAIPSTFIEAHLDNLRSAEVDPVGLGLASASIFNTSFYHGCKLETNHGLIIDIGHKQTSLCFFKDGRIVFIRTVLGGGEMLDTGIRKDLDLTLEQAREVKHEHGLLPLKGQQMRSQDLDKLSTSIKNAMGPVVQKIQQSVALYMTNHLDQAENEAREIEKVFLVGGTSCLQHLPEFMEENLGLPCERLDILADEHLIDQSCKFATAIGVAMKAAVRGEALKKVTNFDFRKGPFAFAKDLSGLKNILLFFAKWVLVIFMVGICAQGVRYFQLKSQLDMEEKKALSTFKRVASDLNRNPKSSAAALRMMQGHLGDYRNKQEILTAGLNDQTALGVLLEISQLIPQTIPLDAQEMSIDQNKITLRAQTDSFESIDRIVSAIKSKDAFQNIDLGDRREATDGKKAFTLTITIESKE